MNWTGFYALANAWLLLLLLPLVILYFLKLKRPRMEISSLALWQQVINDQRVNSPFQKFKRNLLLLLQFLLLISLILAAMQPFLRSGLERAQYIPVLIDCSASMGALDQDGKTRLDVVKARVEKLIDDLLPDQRLSLISMGASATRVTSFTDNKRMLRAALNQIKINDVPSEIEGALRLSQALTRTNRIEKVIVYSDGNVPEMIDFELPFELNYQRVPAGEANIGITALNARRAESGAWNVFVRVQASSHVVAANVEVLQDGTPIAKDYVKLEPEAAQRLVFRVTSDSQADVRVNLVPDGADSLATDNSAGIQIPQSRPLAVYCQPSLKSFRHALAVLENVEVYPATASADLGRSQFDLAITDGELPEGTESTVSLFSGVVPSDLESVVTVNTGAAEVVDWQRNAALLQHVQLDSVLFSDEPSSFPDKGDADYEAAGYEILAHSRNAPLILQRRTENQLTYHLLFHPDRSTLPYRVGFPVLVNNAVGAALREAALSEVRGVKTGVFPPMAFGTPESNCRITDPSGKASHQPSSKSGVLSGVPAFQIGEYQFQAGDEQRTMFASLLNARETSLAAADRLQFRELSVKEADTEVQTDRPLWPWLAMLGFSLLLVEWWYSNRRAAAF